MAIEAAERVPHPDIQKTASPAAPLRVDKIGLLRDILGYLAEKRGATADHFIKNGSNYGRRGSSERSSVIEELIEWNEEVPIGANIYEIAFVLKRDRTTIIYHRKKVTERAEKEKLRTGLARALDELVREPVTDLFIYDPNPNPAR